MAITADLFLPRLQSLPVERPGIRLSLLRLDELHLVVSGNKWYKLRYNLEAAIAAGHRTVLTFGGPYSNHLAATAAAAAEAGLRSAGIVRGMPDAPTPTMITCREYGMELHGVSRADYSRKTDPEWLEALQQLLEPAYVIPEGGANEAGRRGAGEIAAAIPKGATHICLAVGTGTTLAGLRGALPAHQQLIGFTAMKGGAYLEADIRSVLAPAADAGWRLEEGYHFGGFARCPGTLRAFIRDFYSATGIPLDIVYTGKMMWGVYDLLAKGHFGRGDHIVCIHTGGLQGNPADLFAAFT